ncbi:uncharacterized protein ACR2FA_007640 [Aphomia sociella]
MEMDREKALKHTYPHKRAIRLTIGKTRNMSVAYSKSCEFDYMVNNTSGHPTMTFFWRYRGKRSVTSIIKQTPLPPSMPAPMINPAVALAMAMAPEVGNIPVKQRLGPARSVRDVTSYCLFQPVSKPARIAALSRRDPRLWRHEDKNVGVLHPVEVKPAVVSRKRPSSEILVGKAKKNKHDNFDVLFGNEKVDLRQVPQVKEINVPPPPSMNDSTKAPSKMAEPRNWKEVKERNANAKKTSSSLDMLASVMTPSAVAPASASEHSLAEPLFSKPDKISGLETPSEEKPANPIMPNFANINVNDLFAKLVATGIVQVNTDFKAEPKEEVKEEVKPKSKEDKNVIHKVDLSRSDTLKVLFGNEKVDLRQVPQVKEINVPPPPSMNDSTKAPSKMAEPRNWKEVKERNANAKKTSSSLDMLASVMTPSAVAPASASEHSLAEPLFSKPDKISGLETPSEEKPANPIMPNFANINVNDLFAKLVATGIVQVNTDFKAEPKEEVKEEVKPKSKEDKNVIHKVDLSRSDTLKVLFGNEKVDLRQVPQVKEINVPPPPSMNDSTKAPSKMAEPRNWKEVKERNANAKKTSSSLDMLASVMTPSAVAPASASEHSLAEPLFSKPDKISGLETPSEEKPANPIMPNFANINVNDLFAKLVATGIVQVNTDFKAEPKEEVKEEVKPKSKEDKNVIHKVDLSRSDTLKVLFGNEKVDLRQVPQVKEINVPPPPSMNDSTKAPSKMAEPRNWKEVKERNANAKKTSSSLDMLASVMTPSAVAPASASEHSLAEPLFSKPDKISGLETPSEEKPANPIMPNFANINVNDLFAKLVATGIVQVNTDFKAEPKEEVKEEVKPKSKEDKNVIHKVDLSRSDTLKVAQPALVWRLYGGMQCSGCGARFPPEHTVRYSQHLDWHFRQNRRERDSARRAHSRRWAYDLADWLQYEELEDLDEREKNWFETSGAAGPEAAEEAPSVAAGALGDHHCALCGDTFQQFYNEDEEEWHLRNSVRHEDNNYHPLCCEDYKASLTKEEPQNMSTDDDTVIETIEEPIEIKDVDDIMSQSDNEPVVEVVEPEEKQARPHSGVVARHENKNVGVLHPVEVKPAVVSAVSQIKEINAPPPPSMNDSTKAPSKMAEPRNWKEVKERNANSKKTSSNIL